jgi:selenocysteine lyase/cysteine desulfurase
MTNPHFPLKDQFNDHFMRQKGVVPLNNAALCPLHKQSAAAMSQTIQELLRPDAKARTSWARKVKKARETFAQLTDCTPAEMTFMPNVATSMAAVASALNLKPGDEIVTTDQEYGSNAFPWHEAAKRTGARILMAPSEVDWSLDTERVGELVGPRTRVVAVSWVQYQTGVTLDLINLGTVCKHWGALLVVDTTQGLGVTPFSMEHQQVDIISGSMHKWIGGPPGAAYLGINKNILPRLNPLMVGPYSYGEIPSGYIANQSLLPDASRFRTGTPSLITLWGAAVAAQNALDLGISFINQRAITLANSLVRGLQDQGHRVLSPPQLTSPIVTFIPKQGAQVASERLANKGITFSLRGGGIRLSPHWFNRDSDIRLAISTLKEK